MLSNGQTSYLLDLSRALETTGPGEKGELVSRAARALGLSVPSLYRKLKTVTGYGRGRKARSDAGKGSTPRELALTVAGLIKTTTRANGKRTLSIIRACEILAAQGYGVINPETGEVTMPSASTISRAMRREGCHPDQLAAGSPSVSLRSLHPNHTWQIDASICVLYYLPGDRKKGGLALMDERKYNERKPGALADIGNYRIVRYVIADHTSHCLYVWYERAKGESAEGVIRTVINAASDRGPNDPMHGVPFILNLDQSGGNKAALVKEFCAALDIELVYHAPGNARATGSVEKAQHIVETEFEGRLRFLEIPDIAALQEKADAWRRHFNARAVHTRLKCPRNQAWLKIPNDKLRVAERGVMEAVATWGVVTRQISPSFTISVDTRTAYGVQEYDLRMLGYAGLNVRDMVTVRLNPFKAPAVTVIKTMADGQERQWEALPIQKDENGFRVDAPVIGQSYAALPETAADRAAKDIATLAAPVIPAGAVDAGTARKAARPFGHIDGMADVREAPAAIRKAGRALAASVPVAEAVPLSHLQAARRLRNLDPAPWKYDAAACNARMRELYPAGVPESDLAALAADLKSISPVALNYAAALAAPGLPVTERAKTAGGVA